MLHVRKCLTFLLAIGLIGGGPAGAQLILGGTFVSGNWYGTAHDRNGRFSHCAMNANYGPASMYFAVSGNWSWRVGWNFETWTLRSGETVAVTVQIDKLPQQQLTARARNATLVMAELPKDGELFTQFQRGHALDVTIGGRTMTFLLEGTDAALKRLTDCVSQQLKAAGARPTDPDQ